MKLTEAQAKVVDFMVDHSLHYVHYYTDPYGDGKGAGFCWLQWPQGIAPPKLDGRVINGLVGRGVFVYDGSGDYKLTDAARESRRAALAEARDARLRALQDKEG